MGFIDCWKQRFKCEDTFESRWEAAVAVQTEAKKAENVCNGLRTKIEKEKKLTADKEKALALYERTDRLFDGLPPLKDVGKPIDEEEIRAIFKSHWGADLVPGGSYSSGDGASMGKTKWDNPYRRIEAHFITSKEFIRIPMEIMKSIASRSLVSEWTHSYTKQHIDGPYACNDFAASFYYEYKLAPLGYWQTFIGILALSGHRINCFIPAEEDKVYYLEPQNDTMWLPNLNKDSNERKPFLMHF